MPEFSRPFGLERLHAQATMVIEADAAERAAVARRMGLEAVNALTCRFQLRPGEAGSVLAAGHLAATVVQTCVVSLEPFEAGVTEDFLVRFVPEGALPEALDLEGEDEIPYEGNVLDLGEAATEQLALALEPFPRKPGATLPEETPDLRPSPFAALARLRDPSA